MKILIVEDDPMIARTLKLLLSSCGYAADTAADGEAGLEMVDAFEYDLMLLDMILPGLSGISMCQQLRAKKVYTPILLLTGQGEGQQKVIALNAGADDYVVKPFEPEELIARVQALLRRGEVTSQPILTWGYLSVDPSIRQVTYGNRSLSLTPKEYAIVELFLRSPQKTFSSQAILDHVWSSAECPGEEAVRVHIKELRHKLIAVNAPKDLIKTVYRVGYRLNPIYSSNLATRTERLTEPQVAELKSVNGELRVALEELQSQNEQLESVQQALELEHQRYLDLFEFAPDAYLITDVNGVIQEANHAASTLLDIDCQYLIGQSLIALVSQPDRDNFQAILTNFSFTQNWEININSRGCDPLPVALAITVIKDLQNETVGLRCLLHDMRPQKAMEQQLQTSRDALQQQIRQEYLLTDIAQDIRRSLNLNDVLSRTVNRVRELLDTDRVIILRLRPNWQGDVIMESVGEAWASMLSTTIHDPCLGDRYIEPYRQGRIVGLPDIDQEDLEPCYAELLKSFQVKANLVVPILRGDNLWGLLIAHHCAAPRQWQPTEIVLLKRLSNQVGIAIQQSELYEQTQHELIEREQMQTALEESEELFRTLSEAAPIGICQINADGICLYTNGRWQEMSGLSFEESLGDGWLRAVHPEDRDTVAIAWKAYLQGSSEPLPEFRLLTPEREICWISVRVATMKSASDVILGYVCIVEEITERRLAEIKLREMSNALSNAVEGISRLNEQGKYTFVNEAYADIAGYAPEEMIGMSWQKLVYPEDLKLVLAAYQTMLNRGKVELEVRGVRKDGSIFHEHLSMIAAYNEQQHFIGYYCFTKNISEKKQLESQFYHAQRLESLGTLASGIAHDLNNTLTPILAIAQLLRLKQASLDTQTQEMLQVLEESAKRGASMVKQILTFARGEEGKRIPLQVASLLQNLIKIIQQTFPKLITIREAIPEQPLWLVSADPIYLHQVLMNLCINARDAMPDGGVLTLSAQNYYVDELLARANLDAQVGNYVVITVTDTGIGIPSEVRERIFEPFFTTKELDRGTGLGLSIVLGIVKSYRGFLQLSSEVGQGSQFKVYLPATEELSSDIPQKEKLLTGNGERVLIVDDDLAVRQANQSLLESHHYTTLLASDGIDAIALYAKYKADIDVVLMDVMMPNMDGIAAIRVLRKMNPEARIIAVSGLPANQNSALAAGATTFLAKPYTLEELLKQLYTLVGHLA